MDNTVAEKVDTFFNQFKQQTYKKGEVLVRADDSPPGVFYLKEGIVKKYAISRKGEELVVNLFKSISFFPMSWAINDTENKYFYEAMTVCEVWKAPREKILEFIKKEPEVLYDLMSRVYKGVDGMLANMVYLMSRTAYDRLVFELLTYSKRFGETDKNTGVITCLIIEKDIAAQLGMARETVSRGIKLLKQKKLINYSNKKLTIQNTTRLEEELSKDFSTVFL